MRGSVFPSDLRPFWSDADSDRQLPRPDDEGFFPLDPLRILQAAGVEMWRDPETVFRRLYARSKTAFWLDSGHGAFAGASFSFMGDISGPRAAYVQYDVGRGELQVHSARGVRCAHMSMFDYLEHCQRRPSPIFEQNLPFDFAGGCVGFLGYEMKADLGAERVHAAPTPDAAFVLVDRFVAFDHKAQKIYVVCLSPAGAEESDKGWLASMARTLRALPRGECTFKMGCGGHVELLPRHNVSSYLAMINESLSYIEAGESYEICLTNQVAVRTSVDPLTTYLALRRQNPAPYGAYLCFPGVSVLSASPERFLKISPQGWVESKPIKGTAQRGRGARQDATNARMLRESAKNRAENLMIVDLVRNDLGRVCVTGTVCVPKLFDVESYATVHQLVSTIAGELRADVTPVECVRAAFPGGSMTGAPKKRTMELLDLLEAGPRGIYAGALGWFSLNGAVDLSVVIRTIVCRGREVSFGIGGAIVALSEPQRELEESWLKARALVEAIACGAREGR